MRIINIKTKLSEIGVEPETVCLGEFDVLGEFTAKRERQSSDPNYSKFGAFYRSNYERGILIYNLIRRFNLKSFLEVGFGRGYGSLCAAKAFHDGGVDGRVVSIDPNVDERFLQALQQVLPKQWFNYIHLHKGTSQAVLPTLNDQKFDLIYIDGDHSYEGTKHDWVWAKDRFNSFLLFDDYHLPTKNDPGIKCSQLIDEIDDPSKELIRMDRRMFLDDRHVSDKDLDYGQVLLSKVTAEGDDW